jgi:hypothetical protein
MPPPVAPELREVLVDGNDRTVSADFGVVGLAVGLAVRAIVVVPSSAAMVIPAF